jgi:hypothetical protein
VTNARDERLRSIKVIKSSAVTCETQRQKEELRIKRKSVCAVLQMIVIMSADATKGVADMHNRWSVEQVCTCADWRRDQQAYTRTYTYSLAALSRHNTTTPSKEHCKHVVTNGDTVVIARIPSGIQCK